MESEEESARKFIDILALRHRAPSIAAAGKRLFYYLLLKKQKTSTCYMLLQSYRKDYQLVAKKQGVKGIPPLSSFILLFVLFWLVPPLSFELAQRSKDSL